MRKLVMFCAVVGLMSSPVLAATVYYVPDSITDSWTEMYETQSVTITSTDTNPSGAQTEFAGSTTATVGWWSIGIGLEHFYPNGLDLTGYDEIHIEIKNENQSGGDKVWVRGFSNCGWVPNPGDQRQEGSETWLDPGASFTSVIDISGVPATHIDQFTKIGIEVGMNADQQVWDTDGSYAGTCFNVSIVPEPTTVVLLGLGALGLLRRRRK